MTPTAILEYINRFRNRRIALVAHVRPDGDALGSTIGLARILRAAGYDATAVVPDPIPPYLTFLLPPGAPLDVPEGEWWRDYGCLGLLDCSDTERLHEAVQPATAFFPDELGVFVIDHHRTLRDKPLWGVEWIHPGASSVGEMIVGLATAGGLRIDPEAAQALWTAIITDTGRFSYENATPAALAAGLACVTAGARPEEAATHLYQSVSPAERRLQRAVLNNMELLHDGKLATSWLTRRDFLEAGSGPEDAQNLINILRDTSGVEAAVFFYEPLTRDGYIPSEVKASLRTRAPHSALEVAVQFGGGGHVRAAGCSISAPLDEARRLVLDAMMLAYFTPPSE